LEVGPKEMKQKTVTIIQRHTLKRREVHLENLDKEIKKAFSEKDQELLNRAERLLKKNIGFVSNLTDVSEAVMRTY